MSANNDSVGLLLGVKKSRCSFFFEMMAFFENNDLKPGDGFVKKTRVKLSKKWILAVVRNSGQSKTNRQSANMQESIIHWPISETLVMLVVV